MKRLIILLLLGFLQLAAAWRESRESYRIIEQESFSRGEELDYLVHYLFVNAGTAHIEVSPKLYAVNGRPCYRIDVYGRSIGGLEMVTRIRDFWRSYVDTASIAPHRFYRNIQEGRYKKEETTDFYPLKRMAKVKDEKGVHMVQTPSYVQDIVSGFYFMRTINFDRHRNGDTLVIPGILESDVYHLQVIYLGKEVVQTKFGWTDAYVLSPVMPPNELFRGTHPVKTWISADKNKIPVKIQADLLVGAVEVDLEKYKNLRHPISFRNKP